PASPRLSFYPSGALRHLHSFPTRRSSDLDLARAFDAGEDLLLLQRNAELGVNLEDLGIDLVEARQLGLGLGRGVVIGILVIDRRSEEHTSELQSRSDLVCRLLLEKKKKHK